MKKLCLIILDGYGIANTFDNSDRRAFLGSLITDKEQERIELPTLLDKQGETSDAVCTATYDKFRKLFLSNPYTLLNASSYFVGLPYAQMGNSEVGHLNIGA
ncbi:MAG: 2,3-bisphosphoglycerate-independent phosphoglycerate mutase, partial [Christensenellales bacterium]